VPAGWPWPAGEWGHWDSRWRTGRVAESDLTPELSTPCFDSGPQSPPGPGLGPRTPTTSTTPHGFLDRSAVPSQGPQPDHDFAVRVGGLTKLQDKIADGTVWQAGLGRWRSYTTPQLTPFLPSFPASSRLPFNLLQQTASHPVPGANLASSALSRLRRGAIISASSPGPRPLV
jgi:hypothetical protein